MNRDQFGAGALLTSWDYGSNNTEKTVLTARDYKKMNKLACKEKVTTAKGQVEFRNEKDIR